MSDSHPRNFQLPGKLESLKLLYVRSRTSSDENPPNPRGRSHSRFMLQREEEGAAPCDHFQLTDTVHLGAGEVGNVQEATCMDHSLMVTHKRCAPL